MREEMTENSYLAERELRACSGNTGGLEEIVAPLEGRARHAALNKTSVRKFGGWVSIWATPR